MYITERAAGKKKSGSIDTASCSTMDCLTIRTEVQSFLNISRQSRRKLRNNIEAVVVTGLLRKAVKNMEQDLLEKYQNVVENNPFAAAIGLEILKIREGYAYARVRKRKKLENIYGDIHGGCLYAVADNMAGIAASTCGHYVTTVNGSIQYLKAGRNTEYIFCEAEVIKSGRTISVVSVRIRDDQNRLLNTAEFTFFQDRKSVV